MLGDLSFTKSFSENIVCQFQFGTCINLLSSYCIASLIKRYFTFMLFSLLRDTWLVDSLLALWLSPPRDVGRYCECFKSHNSYSAAAAGPWYFAPLPESTNACCVLFAIKEHKCASHNWQKNQWFIFDYFDYNSGLHHFYLTELDPTASKTDILSFDGAWKCGHFSRPLMGIDII